MLPRKTALSVAIIAMSAVTTPLAWSADVIAGYNYSVYFDNIMSLDSNATYDPSMLPLEQFNDLVRSELGPAATLDVLESFGAMTGEQAVYDLSGGNLGLQFHGENQNDAVKSVLVFTGLVGDAEVTNTFAIHSLTSFDFGPIHSEDIWTTTQQTRTRLHRRDAELTFRHDLSDNFGWLVALRYERVEAEYTGRLQTMASTNLFNAIYAYVGAPLVFDIGRQDGAMRGDMKLRLYTAKAGLQSMVSGEKHRFFLAAMLQYSHAPEIKTHAELTPDDSNEDPIRATLESESQDSAGVDLSVGYSFHFIPDRLALELRYRTMAYFPVSQGTNWDDPRVNHGLYAGITTWFRH